MKTYNLYLVEDSAKRHKLFPKLLAELNKHAKEVGVTFKAGFNKTSSGAYITREMVLTAESDSDGIILVDLHLPKTQALGEALLRTLNTTESKDALSIRNKLCGDSTPGVYRVSSYVLARLRAKCIVLTSTQATATGMKAIERLGLRCADFPSPPFTKESCADLVKAIFDISGVNTPALEPITPKAFFSLIDDLKARPGINIHDWCEGRYSEDNVFPSPKSLLRQFLGLSEKQLSEVFVADKPCDGLAEALKCITGMRDALKASACWVLALGQFQSMKLQLHGRVWTEIWKWEHAVQVLKEQDNVHLFPRQERTNLLRNSALAFLEMCRCLFERDKEKSKHKDHCVIERVQIEHGTLVFETAISIEALRETLTKVILPDFKGRHMTACAIHRFTNALNMADDPVSVIEKPRANLTLCGKDSKAVIKISVES